MSQAPKTEANRLTDRLNQLNSRSDKISRFELNSLRIDAKKLQKSDACTAFFVLAGIAFLEHNTEEMLQFHEKSIKAASANNLAFLNYSVSLQNTGRYQEAYDHLLKVVKAEEFSNPKTLNSAVEFAISAGLYVQSNEHLERLRSMKYDAKRSAEVIESALTLIRKIDGGEKEVNRYYELVTQVLTKFDVYPQYGETWTNGDDGLTELVREIFVETSPQVAADMNEMLSHLTVRNKFSVQFLMSFVCVFTVADPSRPRLMQS